MPRKKFRKKKPTNQVRITGGQLRGRVLSFADIKGLRPSGDRSREVLFNWLMPYLPDYNVLDAFTGSGALGFEALSRGAKTVTFLDNAPAVIKQIKHYSNLFKQQDKSIIQQADTFAWLADNQQRFDLIFLDPPFAFQSSSTLIELIEKNQTLNQNGLIYLEQDKSENLPQLSPHWEILKQKEMGQIRMTLIK